MGLINNIKEKLFGRTLRGTGFGYGSGLGFGGWFGGTVLEPFSGAWQRNIEWRRNDVLSHFAVFSCISLISSDIAKLPINYVVEDSDGIWNKVKNRKFSVLDKPNHYQNRMQFIESWLNSKLIRGNAYILKGRDRDGNIDRMYVLHPDFVTPLVADNGDVFYQLSYDDLNKIGYDDLNDQKFDGVNITVPASEIIHDRFNCFLHPLVGLSPIYACGLAAHTGLEIIKNSAKLFGNASRPSGILTAPGAISNETAARLKESWEANYSGENYGKTAILGDDLKYQPLTVTAVESQLIDQLKISADVVCAAFHVPPYKVIASAPAYNNIEALESAYYGQCLQVLIESAELLLDEAFKVDSGTGFEFDISVLLRMDRKTQIESLSAAVKGSIMTPNAAMKELNQKPVIGGDTVYLQQQNYSLEALSKRDAMADPFNAQDTVVEEPPIAPVQQMSFDKVMVKMMQNREATDYAA